MNERSKAIYNISLICLRANAEKNTINAQRTQRTCNTIYTKKGKITFSFIIHNKIRGKIIMILRLKYARVTIESPNNINSVTFNSCSIRAVLYY